MFYMHVAQQQVLMPFVKPSLASMQAIARCAAGQGVWLLVNTCLTWLLQHARQQVQVRCLEMPPT